MNDIEWQLRTCYTSQTSTVKKNLAEGFEPFWGYRCTQNNKPDVKMYFRKAIVEVVELPGAEILESEPPVVQIDPEPVREMLAGLLNDLAIDIAAEIKKERKEEGSGYIMSSSGVMNHGRVEHYAPDGSNKQAATSIKEDDLVGLTDEEVQADMQEMREEKEREIPAGDQIRVVDDVPDLPKKKITSYQQESLNRLRNTSEVNITVYPVDNEGNVRVFSGGKIYTIHRDGSIIEAENRAGRDSTAV